MRFVFALCAAPRGCQGGGDDTCQASDETVSCFAAGCPGPHHCHTALPLQDVVFSARVRSNFHMEEPPHRETHALMAADQGRHAMSCNGGGIPESINPSDEKGINVLQTNCHRAVGPHTALHGETAGLWSVGYQACLPVCTSFPHRGARNPFRLC